MNRTIRARIYESAVKRVTRIYAATLSEIFVEALQNSRRAGAARVRISVAAPAGHPQEAARETGDTPLAVTIADDGAGIADPAVLLSFGENGWDEELVRREDAAGFGFASLARRNCAVSSRPRSPDAEIVPGWRVELAPEHFLGEADAEVRADESAPFPHGTAISFQATETAEAIRSAAETAARHYPLPVIFEDGTDGETAGKEELPRRAFLDGAVHAERWRGLVFGVFRSRHIGYRDPDLNFFGLNLTVGLSTVETVHGATWTVLADVAGCPDLELVLPARKEAVENDFLEEMRAAAQLALYRAMAADPNPRPAFEDWTRARGAGIEMAPPPALLQPWRPSVANVDDWRDPPKLAAVDRDALVMDCDLEPPQAQALWRAAERDGFAPRLFEADRRLEGYGWHDGLDRAASVTVLAAAEGDWLGIGDWPRPERAQPAAARLPSRPDAIRIELSVRPAARPSAMDGEKRILVFSMAGGTGRSYHADLSCGNTERRIHYLLEPGWRADQAIQGLGRTHRTHQASAPLFRPVPDFVTPAEEERLLLRIGAAPWLAELSRRVQHYGYRYDYRGTSRPEPAAPFPRWAEVMADRLREHFGGALPVQCIVNEYRPGQGIGMHADHRDFGDVVASLSLGADWPMRFRPRSARPYARDGLPGDEVAVLPRRSLLVLAGAARRDWMHGIDRADSAREAATRVSATFRTLAG